MVAVGVAGVGVKVAAFVGVASGVRASLVCSALTVCATTVPTCGSAGGGCFVFGRLQPNIPARRRKRIHFFCISHLSLMWSCRFAKRFLAAQRLEMTCAAVLESHCERLQGAKRSSATAREMASHPRHDAELRLRAIQEALYQNLQGFRSSGVSEREISSPGETGCHSKFPVSLTTEVICVMPSGTVKLPCPQMTYFTAPACVSTR